MTGTPNLALPLIAAAQAQKHVTHNEALFAIDALLQAAVLDRDLAAPPTSPAEGDRYIVAAPATGAWAGKAGRIASRQDGVWRFHAPRAGFVVFVLDENLLYVHDGTAWAPLSAGLLALNPIGLLGIGTTADAANPVSAKLNSALWTARTAAEGGTGDLRYVMNKEASARTTSLLFQTGHSGRAEIGLAGDDQLRLKVSQDGVAWNTALRADGATGAVDLAAPASVLASAAITDLGAASGLAATVSGSATIGSFGPKASALRFVLFSGSAKLTHDPVALALPGRRDIATLPGDAALAISDAAGHWQVRHFQRADGSPLVGGRVVGELVDYTGTVLPPLFLWPDGRTVSRTTYAALLAATTIGLTGTLTSGSATMSGVAGSADALARIAPGMPIEGAGIPAGATVAAYNAGTGTITLGAPATASGSAVVATIFPYGSGDGSTTFGIVDVRGRVTAARDNLGGSAAGRLTSAGSGLDAQRLGAAGGDQFMQQHSHSWGANTKAPPNGAGGPGFGSADSLTSPAGSGGSQNVQPTLVIEKILYAGA